MGESGALGVGGDVGLEVGAVFLEIGEGVGLEVGGGVLEVGEGAGLVGGEGAVLEVEEAVVLEVGEGVGLVVEEEASACNGKIRSKKSCCKRKNQRFTFLVFSRNGL